MPRLTMHHAWTIVMTVGEIILESEALTEEERGELGAMGEKLVTAICQQLELPMEDFKAIGTNAEFQNGGSESEALAIEETLDVKIGEAVERECTSLWLRVRELLEGHC